MNKILASILGNSWQTTLAGYGTAAAIAGWDYVQASGDLTKLDPKGLVAAVGLAILGRLAKDHNVSNAPAPLPESQVVKK